MRTLTAPQQAISSDSGDDIRAELGHTGDYTGLSRDDRRQLTHDLLVEASGEDPGQRRDDLLDEVVLINQGVAEAVAHRYRGRGVPTDDLCQAALEGLVKAVRRFDPAVRPDLLTYAVPTMRGEIQRWFRDQSWMVRPPRRIQELQYAVSRSSEQLSQDLGHQPDDEEIADHVGCTVDEVAEAGQAFGCFSPPSLDAPVATAEGRSLGDVLADDADTSDLSASEARTVLAPAVRHLSERDRRILYLRFFEDQTQNEIGEELGITQMQVSRLLARIFRDLRSELD